MSKIKHYTNSQLKWLAESLTNKQMAFLLEGDDQNQNANQNAGLADQPQNPGMKTVDNKAAMKPDVNQKSDSQNNQNQQETKKPQDEKSQIKTVCHALKSGALKSIEPSSMVKFLKDAGISLKVLPKAVNYALLWIKSQAKNDENVQAVCAGCSNCMGVLLGQQNQIAESVMTNVRKNINLKELKESIRYNHTYNIFRYGKTINESCGGYKADIARYQKMNEHLREQYSHSMDSNVKMLLENSNSMLSELHNKADVMNQINEYYKLSAQLKNLEKISESSIQINLYKYRNLKKVTDKRMKVLNENMSAIKFALNFYKKNK